jgi:hypothetical protein
MTVGFSIRTFVIIIAAVAGLAVVAAPAAAWISGQPVEVWRVGGIPWGLWSAWHMYRLALRQ